MVRMKIKLTIIRDIQVLKTYGAAPYAAELKRLEKQIKEKQTSVNEKIGKCIAILHPKLTGYFPDLHRRREGRLEPRCISLRHELMVVGI